MISRPYWIKRIEESWKQVPIVWLAGVRRVGKTTLAQSLGRERILYVNCDLPATEDMVRDSELFFGNCRQPIVVFDEIHQLRDPARVLKIGADLFPNIKILATGSSTLAASRKFKDTLTGRKRVIHLTPVIMRNRDTIDVIECKWEPSRFDPIAVRVFRQSYPNGVNYVLSPQTAPKYSKRIAALEFQFCNPLSLFSRS